MRRRLWLCALAIGLACAAGCARRPLPTEPGVTFAAHLEHGGLAVDRLTDGGTGAIEAPACFRPRGAPTWVLRDEQTTLAALWETGPSRIEVRAPAAAGPPTARIDPTWEDGAIRLRVSSPDGAALRTTVFARTPAGGGWSVLTRAAQTTLDVRGTFRAELEDADGKPVGWVRARLGPWQPAPRLYDAVLPAALGDGLAAALAVALDGEVEWIEDHAIDVHSGDGDGNRLSTPVGSGR